MQALFSIGNNKIVYNIIEKSIVNEFDYKYGKCHVLNGYILGSEALYDMYGNVVIDLSKYKENIEKKYVSSLYEDGYLGLAVKGLDNNDIYFLVLKDGGDTALFEPTFVGDSWNTQNFKISYDNDEKNYVVSAVDSFYHIDLEGKSKKIDCSEFGGVLYYDNYTKTIMAVSKDYKKCYFLDYNGNILFGE